MVLELCRNAINGQVISEERFLFLAGNGARNNNEKVDVSNLIDELKAQKIQSFAYSALPKSKENIINKDILDNWKHDTIENSIYQIKNVNQAIRVFKRLHEEYVEVVALKGIVLRGIYPRPELRSMGDTDILVHEKDIEKTSEILIEMGYKRSNLQGDEHIIFYHKSYSPVEVHWTIVNRKRFGIEYNFEKNIWSELRVAKVGEIDVLTLSVEDFILHLFIHAMKHTAGSGCGIRQICDIAVILNRYKDEIDYQKLIINLEECKVKKFAYVVLNICDNYFGVEVENIPYKVDCDTEKIDGFVQEIFNAGIYGRKSLSNSVGNLMAYDKENHEGNKKVSVFNTVRYIFPLGGALSQTYTYAKKYPILTPIAWIHRIIRFLGKKEYTLNDKVEALVKSTKLADKRAKLLRWLDI